MVMPTKHGPQLDPASTSPDSTARRASANRPPAVLWPRRVGALRLYVAQCFPDGRGGGDPSNLMVPQSAVIGAGNPLRGGQSTPMPHTKRRPMTAAQIGSPDHLHRAWQDLGLAYSTLGKPARRQSRVGARLVPQSVERAVRVRPSCVDCRREPGFAIDGHAVAAPGGATIGSAAARPRGCTKSLFVPGRGGCRMAPLRFFAAGFFTEYTNCRTCSPRRGTTDIAVAEPAPRS